MRRIVVHIDRIRLHNVSPDDSAAVAAALREALASTLAEPTVGPGLQHLGHLASVRAAATAQAQSSDPSTLGTAAGQAIGRALAR